ncbi:MAG: peptide ABC transporter substrate-binding protein [Planctomycetota bacterium]
MSPRIAAALGLAALGLLGIVWVVVQGQLPPAEYTFNNDGEIESLDPAVVTGQPAGRIIEAVFEGLVRLGPKDREPRPGIAESWELSEDGLTYTFKLRKDAVWSNGEPCNAQDFVYSMRRFLDPLTLAEYAYQAWYLKNAKRYSRAARGVEVGDLVEVELHEQPDGALEYARGIVLRGKLVRVETDEGVSEDDLADAAQFADHRTFVVEVDGQENRFRIGEAAAATADSRACRQLLLDFSEVGFTAPDDHTIVMELETPTPYWLQLVGFYPLWPVNQTCVETYGKLAWTEAENIVTNGPFTLEFRRIRDRMRLRKFADYWDADDVHVESIDALAVESLTTQFNLYETGKCDYITKVSPLTARELLKVDPPREDFYPAPQFGTYFYSMNVTRPPLDDVRVRRALRLAIDRTEIIATAGSVEQPARSFTPPGIPGYDPPECRDTDTEEARRLLAEAGFPGGEGFPRIEILYNFEEQHQTVAELVRKQWRRVLGIDVSTRNEEWQTYLSSTRQLKFDVARRAWIGDYLDPNTFLDLFLSYGENNQTGWGDPEYDEIIEAAKYESDPTARLAMLRRAEEILMDKGPLIPLFYYATRYLVRPHVKGFYYNVQDTHPLRYIRIERSEGGRRKAEGGTTASDAQASPARYSAFRLPPAAFATQGASPW